MCLPKIIGRIDLDSVSVPKKTKVILCACCKWSRVDFKGDLCDYCLEDDIAYWESIEENERLNDIYRFRHGLD